MALVRNAKMCNTLLARLFGIVFFFLATLYFIFSTSQAELGVPSLKQCGSVPSQRGLANVISSECPKLHLVENKSFPDFLFARFDSFGNKRAIVDSCTGHGYSYSQLRELVVKCASALTKMGFRKGDVFAVYCPNVAEFPIVYLSVLSLGGIVTTAPTLATVHELSRILDSSKAKCIVTVSQLASNAKRAARQCGVKEVVVVGEAEGCRPLAHLFQDDGRSFPKDININATEDTAVILWSSGTTGLPKGVMMSHFNLSCNLQQMIDGREHHVCSPDDNFLGLAPFFHIYGLNILQGISLYCGATIFCLQKFEENTLLQVVEKFKISTIFTAPPLVLFLAKSPLVERYDLSSVRDVFSAAAPLSKELQIVAAERLKGVKNIRQIYGMTEMGSVHFGPFSKHRCGSIGTLLPNTETKVIDSGTGEALGVNKKGEICVRGPQIMKGYLNNPEATREIVDSDGWLHTGDLGYYDNEHFFYIIDRCKDLIKYKGYQVAPNELEAILTAHPKIQDAAVIGIPDDRGEELPKAFIVASGITKDEVNIYLENLVAPYKKLRGGIAFVDEIPKSAAGKILRRVLKERELSK